MKIYKKKKTHACYSLATFRPKNAKVRINGRLEAAHKIIMEISLLIMEKSWNNHGILILNFCGNPVSFMVTGKLICIFVFAYAKSRFSHDAAHFFL